MVSLFSLDHAGGYLGCGHGHKGHPGRPHWSCCGKFTEKSECRGQWAERTKESTEDGGPRWLPMSLVTAVASMASSHQRTTDLNSEETDRIKNKVPYVIPSNPRTSLWVIHWWHMGNRVPTRDHITFVFLARGLAGRRWLAVWFKLNARWCPSSVSFLKNMYCSQ